MHRELLRSALDRNTFLKTKKWFQPKLFSYFRFSNHTIDWWRLGVVFTAAGVNRDEEEDVRDHVEHVRRAAAAKDLEGIPSVPPGIMTLRIAVAPEKNGGGGGSRHAHKPDIVLQI